MRIGSFARTAACAAGVALIAGCGTGHAPSAAGATPNLTAAVSRTEAQTARIAATVSTESRGMTLSFTETGLFDFARSRGIITLASPIGMTEIFIPPTTYVKDQAETSDGGALPKGKTWMALPDVATGGGALPGLDVGGDDPAELLASLTALSGGVTRLGPATIRGVPVTGFALEVDPAKATGRASGADQTALEALGKLSGTAEIPVDVWVDGQNLVRREKLTLTGPAGPAWPDRAGGTGAAGGTRLVITTDFYDFGVPVLVSAPPAAQVATEPDLMPSSSSSSSGSGSGSGSGSVGAPGSSVFSGAPAASPPAASGTLTPAQATAAEQAVAAFWAALGRNNTTALAQTVLPAERSCVRSELGGGAPAITVSALHITAARPAGDGGATVLFTVKATASVDGQTIPVSPAGPGGPQWLAAREVAGHWYVNLASGGTLGVGVCS